MSERSSAEKVNESEVEQVKVVFSVLQERYKETSQKEKKINDIKAVIRTLISAEVIEERAERNMKINFCNGIADVLPSVLHQFLSTKSKKSLIEISSWLKGSAEKKLREEGFGFQWIGQLEGIYLEVEGIYLEVRTITEEEQKEMEEGTPEPQGIRQKITPDTLRELSEKLMELGFDCQFFETLKVGELYNLKASQLVLQKESAIVLLRAGIEIRHQK